MVEHFAKQTQVPLLGSGSTPIIAHIRLYKSMLWNGFTWVLFLNEGPWATNMACISEFKLSQPWFPGKTYSDVE